MYFMQIILMYPDQNDLHKMHWNAYFDPDLI